MSKYIVRIELRDSESADYEKLHDSMKANGFYRFAAFSGSTGHFHLPDAEYLHFGDGCTIYSIGKLAHRLAQEIKANPKIMVSKSDEIFQLGLDKF